MHKPTSDIWEAEYKALQTKYDKLHAEHLLLQQRDTELHSKCVVQEENLDHLSKTLVAVEYISDARNKHSLKLRAEIRALQRKLRDANRGAERLHLINAQLRIELVDYKLKHPENTEVEIFKGTMRCGVDLAQGLDQTVTYNYDGKAHTAKI